MKLKNLTVAMLLLVLLFALGGCAKKRTPYIGENGNWWVGDTDLGVAAQGPQGEAGPAGEKGPQGLRGETGAQGEQGLQGPAGEQGAVGPQGPEGERGPVGASGLTPFVGENGNWWIGDTDTGIFVGAYSEPSSDGLSFSLETYGGKAGAIVTGYRGTDTDVVIPSCFCTAPVIGVEATAFAGNKKITSVRLSANTVYLGEGAFEGCENLTQIDFGGAPITEIPARTFKNTALRFISIPEGVKSIGADAFLDVMNTIVCIPSSVTHVETAFSSDALLVIAASAAPSWLNGVAGGEGKARYVLDVDAASTVYDKESGACLSYEDGAYVMLKLMTDAEGVLRLPAFYEDVPIRRILSGAVECAATVTDLVIGEGITRLEPNAIRVSHALRSVYLPASLTEVAAAGEPIASQYLLCGAQSAPSGFAASEIFTGVAEGLPYISGDYLYALHAEEVTLLRYIGDPYVSILCVPEAMEGKPVSTLKSGFFSGYHTNEIYVPTSVKRIERHAFAFLKDTASFEAFSSTVLHFAVIDPALVSYDPEMLAIHPEDMTVKSIYFNGIKNDEFLH